MLKKLIGQEIGVSDWFLIDQDRINRFAECAEDTQWIHTDAARAAKGPFGKTIAPGFLVLSLIPAMSQSRRQVFGKAQVEMIINYGLNRVRFLNPVPVNSRIRSRITLVNIEERAPGQFLLTSRHTIEIEGQTKPACVADVLGLFVLK
jgi:acyl dehydratase